MVGGVGVRRGCRGGGRLEAEFSNARLTGSRWSLGAEGRPPWSSNIHFLPSGRIGGYSSPNEVYWSLEHVVLRIFRSNHQEMWRFTEPHLVDGLWQATAVSHAAPDLHTPCRLKEVEKPCTIVPKEADLVASRWSLAEAGKPPWSSSLYFLTDGSIGGYSSPNEVYWSLTDSVLRIFRGNRQEMWRFGDFELIDGKLCAVGSYQAEPNVALLCQLTQLEKAPRSAARGRRTERDGSAAGRFTLEPRRGGRRAVVGLRVLPPQRQDRRLQEFRRSALEAGAFRAVDLQRPNAGRPGASGN